MPASPDSESRPNTGEPPPKGGARRAVAPVALLIATLALLAALAWKPFMLARRSAIGSAQEEQCQANLQRLSDALSGYEHANGGRLPPADRWSDFLLRYGGTPKAFVCPAAPTSRSGYAYNRAVAGLRASDLANADTLIVLCESDRGWNASGGPELLVRAPRHGVGEKPIIDYYLLANGRVERRLRLSVLTHEDRARYLSYHLPELEWQPKLKPAPASKGH